MLVSAEAGAAKPAPSPARRQHIAIGLVIAATLSSLHRGSRGDRNVTEGPQSSAACCHEGSELRWNDQFIRRSAARRGRDTMPPTSPGGGRLRVAP